MIQFTDGDMQHIQETWVWLISPWIKCPHFTEDSFKSIFMNEKCFILIWIALKFVPKVPIDNKVALVHVMAWHWTGNKPLPEPMLTQLTDANMQH